MCELSSKLNITREPYITNCLKTNRSVKIIVYDNLFHIKYTYVCVYEICFNGMMHTSIPLFDTQYKMER